MKYKVSNFFPGLPYTQKQLFWISYGQSCCAKYTDEELKEYVLEDTHPPGEFRLIGSITNNEDFAKDFNCPVGSKMNPIKKCDVW